MNWQILSKDQKSRDLKSAYFAESKLCSINPNLIFFLFSDEALLENPLEKFRKGYLWVSNLTAQIWCEQQMEYGFTRPQEVKEPEHVFRGSELHLSRELQTEDYIGT